MSGFGNFLYVRTLGEPGMFMNGRKLETAFPSPEAREIFLSLLSPLDECTGWERLENVIRGNPSVTRRKALVRKGVKEIKKMFLRTAGINPLREYPHGVGLDFRTVRVDVHDFRELSFKGLKLFAEGDHAAAGPCLRRALALYAGPFLPGDSGRIIDAAREELEELKVMASQSLAKVRAGTVRGGRLIGKAASGLKVLRELPGAVPAADYPKCLAA